MGAANEAIPELANSKNEVEVVRRGLGNFPPSLWGDRFSSFSFHQSEYQAFDDEIQVLKEQVQRMLIDPAAITSTNKIYLIYHLHRLGLSYHFENEVDGQLGKLFTNLNLEDCDLYSVSLQFQAFRQHGYKLPCDVFNKFTDDTGHFKETLSRDVRGLLSLYQACQLRIRGEEILEKALAFATAHLNALPTELSPRLVKQVTQALRRPFNKGMPRVEAGLYISIYEQEESQNDSLLKLAKMDFNKLRLLHLKELGIVSKWWNDLEIKTTLHYVRDRVVESYFWILGVTFEPRCSLERILYAKLTALHVILDDTYDAYGTIDELQLFTEAVDRWNLTAMDQLPNYMKYVYSILLALYNELDEQMAREGREYAAYYAKEGMKKMIREYYREAVWSTNRIIPPFDEYMENATFTCGHYIMSVNRFTGMGEVATKDAFEWLHSRPKILKASETIARLQDDIATHETEQKRGQFASAVEYYMRQYGASKKETIIELKARIENAWKDMNEECLKPTAVSNDLLMVPVNLARVIDVIYKYDDGFTNAQELQDYIMLLLDKPMDAFEWLQSRPKVLKASETIARLQNDLMTYETEQKRGQCASAVEYYMKQYGTSKKETIIELQASIENAWKDMNEEYLKPTAVSNDLLMVPINLARMIDVFYKYDDGFTNAKEVCDYITLLFNKPMVV